MRLALTNQAIERIRDFHVAQIKALRSPHINAQIIQQQNFLRFKDLYTFLYKHPRPWRLRSHKRT